MLVDYLLSNKMPYMIENSVHSQPLKLLETSVAEVLSHVSCQMEATLFHPPMFFL